MIIDMQMTEECCKLLLLILSFSSHKQSVEYSLVLYQGLLLTTHELGLDLFKFLGQIVGTCCQELEYGGSNVAFHTELSVKVIQVLESSFDQTHARWETLIPSVLVCLSSWHRRQSLQDGELDGRAAAMVLIKKFKLQFPLMMKREIDAMRVLQDAHLMAFVDEATT